MNARSVLFYGQSLLLAGVAASLAENPNLCVSHAATWDHACDLMAEGMPDVLVFDLSGGCEGQILPLLLEKPDLVMVGLDTECNRAVLVSGQYARSLTLAQITSIVEGNCSL